MRITLRNFVQYTITSAILTNLSFAQESEQLQSLNQIRKNIERFSPIFKEEPVLSESSRTALKQLKKPVQIEVFLSPKEHFPPSLLHRRLSALSLIDQISKTASGQVKVVIHEFEYHDPLASVAEELGVSGELSFRLNQELPKTWDRKLYFGAALKGDRGKQIIPYLETVTSIENELVGSIMGSSSSGQKSIGVFPTGALALGKENTGITTSVKDTGKEWEFVLALKKRYDVRPVSRDKGSKSEYDAMVVVQPSLLDDSGIDHLVSLVKSGVPTVIFEDPRPIIHRFPGTYDPRAAASRPGLPPSSHKPPRKGHLSKLWKLLEVNFCELPGDGRKLILRDSFNPFPEIVRSSAFPDEFIFVGGFENAFDASVVSKDIKHLLFNSSGFISNLKNSNLSFEPLVSSGKKTGFTQVGTFRPKDGLGFLSFNSSKTKVPGTGKQQVIAAKIMGKPKGSVSGRELSVIMVSDADFMADTFYQINRRPIDPSFPLKVQNTSFALGVIDHMAKNQNDVGLLGGKYEDPKVLSELDGRIKRIRKEYSRRIQVEGESLEALIQNEQRKANYALSELQSRFRSKPQPDSMKLMEEEMSKLQKGFAKNQKALSSRSERMRRGLEAERDSLIKLLKESPFSGWVRVFDHNGRVRIERNYLSGKPHGFWKRMDASGKEVKNEKFLNENPTPNDFNERDFRALRSIRSKKQEAQAERIRKLFAK